MASTNRQTILIRLVCFLIGGATVAAALHFATEGGGLPAARSAPPHAAEPQHHEDEHAKFEAILRRTMNGPVDVYFDVTEVESDKPLLAGVTFADVVDVTGKHLLRFSDGKNQQWLIDPDTVLTFRISAGKGEFRGIPNSRKE